MKRTSVAVLFGVLSIFVAACGGGTSTPKSPTPPGITPTLDGGTTNNTFVEPSPPTTCVPGAPMVVRFYDAGQALAVLVTLPDGRRLLVDAGESAHRPCRGCKTWHERVMTGLKKDLGSGSLDALWITHQHSDHIGGAADVLTTFKVAAYSDDGLDLDKTKVVKDARAAMTAKGTKLVVVDPDHLDAPLNGTDSVKLTPIVPKQWPSSCPSDPNACSIALRIDYCKSSVLFTGDAPTEEEDLWDLHGEVTLLQVGHHGSDTSTGNSLLTQAKPKYAVISSGKPDEGTNDGYCHPRSITVENLTKTMGGAGTKTVKAFDGTIKCDKQKPAPAHWVEIPAHDHLWSTARDGDIVLTTKGDGAFVKQ